MTHLFATANFRERFTSKMVSCPETADHPDQGLESIDKPPRQAQKLTRLPPVRRRTRPVTTREQHISNTVTRWLMEVIRCTPIKNEA